MRIKTKTLNSLIDSLNSENCVLVLTLASLILGLLLISILACRALLATVL